MCISAIRSTSNRIDWKNGKDNTNCYIFISSRQSYTSLKSIHIHIRDAHRRQIFVLYEMDIAVPIRMRWSYVCCFIVFMDAVNRKYKSYFIDNGPKWVNVSMGARKLWRRGLSAFVGRWKNEVFSFPCKMPLIDTAAGHFNYYYCFVYILCSAGIRCHSHRQAYDVSQQMTPLIREKACAPHTIPTVILWLC